MSVFISSNPCSISSQLYRNIKFNTLSMLGRELIIDVENIEEDDIKPLMENH